MYVMTTNKRDARHGKKSLGIGTSYAGKNEVSMEEADWKTRVVLARMRQLRASKKLRKSLSLNNSTVCDRH